MLIAQMTDIHIGFAPDEKPEELNRVRFRATLDRILEGPNRPDMMVLTGDITDRGDIDSFEKTAALLADCPFPVWPMVGNHDTREALVEAFPQVCACCSSIRSSPAATAARSARRGRRGSKHGCARPRTRRR